MKPADTVTEQLLASAPPAFLDTYRLLFDQNPTPMWVSDAVTLRILSVNPAALQVFGLTREEFLDRNSEQWLPGSVAVNPIGDAVPAERRHLAKDGRVLDLEITRTAVSFEGRDAFLTQARDITSRRTADTCQSLRYGVNRLIAENHGDITQLALQFIAQSLGFDAAELWLQDADSPCMSVLASWRAEGERAPRPEPGDPGDVTIPVRADSQMIGTLFLLGARQPAPLDDVQEALLDVCRQLGQYLKRRSAERERREAEAEFRLLFDDAPVPYHEIDRQGRIVRVNRAECDALGYTAADMIGRPIWDFVAPAEREASRAAISAKMQGHLELQSYERKYRCANGVERIFQFHERLIRDRGGDIVAIRTAMLDVTEMRRAERQVTFQAMLLERMSEAVVACDSNFRITCWNQAAERLYGWKAGDVLGRPFEDVVSMEDEKLEQIRSELLRDGLWQGEVPCRARDGRQLTVDFSSNLLYTHNGRNDGVVGIHRDATARKSTMERLRILSQAVEQSPVSIVITDLHGNIEYANPRACELTQYSLDELKGKNSRVLKSGFTPPEEYAQLWNTIQHGEWHGVFQNRKKNGELYWESATIGPIRDERGVATHYLAVKVDITERRHMEAALQLSEERFRIASENSADLVFEADVASGCFRVFGGRLRADSELRLSAPRSLDELIRFIHPGDRERISAALNRHRISGEPFLLEFRVVLPSGQVRHVVDTATLLRDAEGAPVKWISVIQDVTEARAAERSNAELAAIVESNDAAIISKDLSGTVLTWNPGAERIYGYSASEMVGRNISVLWGPGRPREELLIEERLQRGERVAHLETVLHTKGGEAINVFLSVSPIRDRSGKVVSASHVAWNITEQKRLQRQLSQAQKLEAIGQLAAGVAHEINTPIQYIGDNAKFLEGAFDELSRCIQTGLPGSEDVDLEYLRGEIPAALGQLLQGVDQVARIVRAMKEFSHPGSVEKSMTDLNRAIESSIVVSRNEWKYAAELESDLDPYLPLVPCLVGEFNQVMLNLIVNAAHAIAAKTSTAGGKGLIHISTRHVGAFAEVRVRDTGTGIPEAIQPRIFDPFFTTKAIGKGTGQGLSIAHTVIVQNHQGSIRFETEVGVGTTFIIQLPLQREEKFA